jgi:hypothetical protein
LQRQSQHESPIRHSEQFGPLQHIDVNRCHGDRQREKAPSGSSPCGSVEEAKRAQELEQAAYKHGRARPWDVRRHDAHLQVLGCEMRDAAYQKPQEHEDSANELSAVDAAGAAEGHVLWLTSGQSDVNGSIVVCEEALELARESAILSRQHAPLNLIHERSRRFR